MWTSLQTIFGVNERNLSNVGAASAILTQEIQKIVRCSRKLPHRRDAIGCAYTH